MARLTFLPSDDAYVRAYTGEPQAGIPVTVWTRQVGGTQVTDLVAVAYDGTLGAAITGGVLVSDASGLLPAFAGPDGGAAVLWGSHGVSGERLALYSVSGGGGGGTPTDGSVTLAKLAADTSAAVGGTTTGVKTANYTAAPGETVPADATSGPLTVTLPAASRARDRVVVKKVDSTANAVTIARAGSDVINVSATSLNLALQHQSVVLRSTGAGVWIVEAGDLPYGALTTALNGTFGPGSDTWLKSNAAAFAFAFTGTPTYDTTTGLPTSATVKWPDAVTGTFTGTIDAGGNGYSGFTVTWAGSTTKTVAVTGITYDSNGLALGPTGLAVS
jgi:hypothetical protein